MKTLSQQEIMQKAIDMLMASLRCDSAQEQEKVIKQIRQLLFDFSA